MTLGADAKDWLAVGEAKGAALPPGKGKGGQAKGAKGKGRGKTGAHPQGQKRTKLTEHEEEEEGQEDEEDWGWDGMEEDWDQHMGKGGGDGYAPVAGHGRGNQMQQHENGRRAQTKNQNQNIRNEVRTLKQEVVQLSKGLRDLDGGMTTVLFLKPDEPDLAIPLGYQADDWRWHIKAGTENMGQAHQYIGAKLIGCTTKLIQAGDSYDTTDFTNLLDREALEKWVSWHQDAKKDMGMSRALDESLAEIVVKKKGPRMYKGEKINPEETDRLMVKLRPTMMMAHLRTPVIFLLKAHTVYTNGYISLKQPAPPGIRRLQGRRGGGQGSGGWE